MKRKIQETFDMIHADEKLKDRTREFLAEAAGSSRGHSSIFRLAPALCLALIILAGFGGWQLYFKPVSVISIDINPSLELDVNRFDRVVDVKEYNEDGEKLSESLEILFLNYEDALEEIMADENVQTYLAGDQVMSIVVAGEDEKKTQTVYSNVEACTRDQENTHCYHADSADLEGAHDAGLSYGKYMAYLELKELDPDIAPEDVQGMTMREIRDRIGQLSGNADLTDIDGSGTDDNTTAGGSGSAGNGNQYGNGNGNGNNAGTGNGSGTGAGSGQESGGHHQENYGGHGAGRGRHHGE